MGVVMLVCSVVVALTVESAIFRHTYRDLLYLGRPVAQIVSDTRGSGPLREYGSRALSRRTLRRKHIETLAQAARKVGDEELYFRAIERLARDYPEDREIQLRRAESLRLAGHLTAAAALYGEVLTWGPSQSAAQ